MPGFVSNDYLMLKAGEAASRNFVSMIMKSGEKDKIKVLGVASIENDSKEGSIRDSLHNAFSECSRNSNITMAGMDEMKEKIAALGVLGMQLKYQKHYDAKSLVEIGRMISVQTIVTGRIIRKRVGLRSADISFQGNVLDLEKGEILFSRSADGKYVLPWTFSEMGIYAFLMVLVFSVMAGLSNMDYFYGKDAAPTTRRRIMQSVLVILLIAGFIVYYFYFA